MSQFVECPKGFLMFRYDEMCPNISSYSKVGLYWVKSLVSAGNDFHPWNSL